MNTLQFARNGTTYIFRYTDGDEDQVVGELIGLADDTGCDLDWLDAATLSFQVVSGASRRRHARDKATMEGSA